MIVKIICLYFFAYLLCLDFLKKQCQLHYMVQFLHSLLYKEKINVTNAIKEVGIFSLLVEKNNHLQKQLR